MVGARWCNDLRGEDTLDICEEGQYLVSVGRNITDKVYINSMAGADRLESTTVSPRLYNL